MNQDSNLSQFAKQYREHGVTDIVQVFDEVDLAPVQQIIYDCTKHLIVDHEDSLSLSEKIALPFKSEPKDDDAREVMNAVNESEAIETLKQHEKIKRFFRGLFESDDVTLFPISKFRAQFPTISKTALHWHQDQGSWYAVPVKELAEVLPAIFWLSINGATADNSIEIIPDSHRGILRTHSFVSRQGYFNVSVPNQFKATESFKVSCPAGHGVAFHPLSYHRSIRGSTNRPRYSIDIRYSNDHSTETYKVDIAFKVKRFFAGFSA